MHKIFKRVNFMLVHLTGEKRGKRADCYASYQPRGWTRATVLAIDDSSIVVGLPTRDYC